MPDAAGETEKGVLREVDPGGIGRHGLPTACGGRIKHEAQQRVARRRAKRILDPWSCVDLDEIAGSGTFVPQDLDFSDALIVEQFERPACQSLDFRIWRKLDIATDRAYARQGAALDGDVGREGLAGSGCAYRILDERSAEQGFVDLYRYTGCIEAVQEFYRLVPVGDLGRLGKAGGTVPERCCGPDQQRPG